MRAAGTVHVVPAERFQGTAHLDPASQDRLLAGSGKTAVTLTGSDFEFTTKVEIQKPNDEFATPESGSDSNCPRACARVAGPHGRTD